MWLEEKERDFSYVKPMINLIMYDEHKLASFIQTAWKTKLKSVSPFENNVYENNIV